jgi:predicted AAA+ superfamily ATPase
VLRRGQHENYLREVLTAVVRRLGSQVSWNALARDLSIDHPKTVSDYAALLASMDALFIQPALVEDKLTAAPKKARKLIFTDPFIFYAVRAWLFPTSRPFEDQILPAVADPVMSGRVAEACVATHYRRRHPTYYIKAEGEVHVAYVDRGRFWPVEVKWTEQLRPKELKQIAKYPNARIFNRAKRPGRIQRAETLPLPLALALLG